jgi:hypothetical protein
VPSQQVAAGLTKVLTDTPVGHGYLEAGAALTKLRGPEAWAEAGYHPWQNVGLFARGEATAQDAGIMAGVRFTF